MERSKSGGPAKAGHYGESRAFADLHLLVELFVVFNFGGLILDIALAHSENQFRHPAEYVPLYFSIVATVTLAALLPLRRRRPDVWRDVGYLVGWVAIATGLAGVILHLDSQFFYERTIRSLTYAAPFAAPLAYTGLGLVLLVNRIVAPATREWAEWLLLLALGGFAGNFVFSLTDHAMNGFFNPIEWLPVVSSAAAIGFLVVPFMIEVRRPYLLVCAAVLACQAAVGMLGFLLHAAADLRAPGVTLLERILSGAPPMAPLLFPNLVILAALALLALSRHLAPAPA